MVPMTQNRTMTRNAIQVQNLGVTNVVRTGLGLEDLRKPTAEHTSAGPIWPVSRIPESMPGNRTTERGDSKPNSASFDAPAGPVGSTPATPRCNVAAAY